MSDFSELFDDEELGSEQLICVRSTDTVGDNGRTISQEKRTGFSAIVTMDKGAIVERVEESTYVAGSIMVTTAFPLRAEGDVVQRNNKRYVVETLGDYLQHGFNWAVCTPEGVAHG